MWQVKTDWAFKYFTGIGKYKAVCNQLDWFNFTNVVDCNCYLYLYTNSKAT